MKSPAQTVSIFGLVRDINSLEDRCARRLGITIETHNFGPQGTLFISLAEGDVVRSDRAAALKLGFIRGLDNTALSARDLLTLGHAQPHAIQSEALQGNGLVACLSTTEPQFSVYLTWMSIPQLYYASLPNGEGVICATALRPLLALLDSVELDETVLPAHLMFRLVPGNKTYYRGVRKLFPGQLLRWHGGELAVRVAKALHVPKDRPLFKQSDPSSIKTLYGQLTQVMGAYLDELSARGAGFTNLISGGSDSSLIQAMINDRKRGGDATSFSFTIDADDFRFEVDYARQAIDSFSTRHRFVPISPADYPDLLTRTIEALAQPNLFNESAPLNLALAETMAKVAPELRYCFAGYAADAQNGINDARSVQVYERWHRRPGARWAVHGLAALHRCCSFPKSAAYSAAAHMLGLKATAFARHLPTSHVANDVTVIDWARRCFADDVLAEALEYREQMVRDHSAPSSMLEHVHVLDLLTAGHDFAVAVAQIFAAADVTLLQFYLDEAVIQAFMAFDPSIRFIEGASLKPLQRKMLEHKSLGRLIKNKKGGGNFEHDLFGWMRQGVLTDMVRSIERPGFMSKADFDRLLLSPDRFLWPLLTYDVLKKSLRRGYLDHTA